MAGISVRARRRSRIGAGVGLVALASMMVTAGTSSVAHADASCPAGLTWTFGGYIDPQDYLGPIWYANDVYTVNSATSDFLVSEQHVVDNGTSSPATATFTSSVSKTFSLSVTVGTSASLFGFLTASVSSSITMSTTTTTGVSATATVPAGGRVIGQYGVEAYDVNYTDTTWAMYGSWTGSPTDPNGYCSATTIQGTTVAPTVYTGWRVLPG